MVRATVKKVIDNLHEQVLASPVGQGSEMSYKKVLLVWAALFLQTEGGEGLDQQGEYHAPLQSTSCRRLEFLHARRI